MMKPDDHRFVGDAALSSFGGVPGSLACMNPSTVSAPDIAGKGIANPLATMLSA